MHVSRKARLIGGGVTILVLGVVGRVYAAWVTNGTGSGYAQAGTAQDLSTVDVSAQTVGDLYPTKDGTLKVQIHNPNSYPVTVTDINAGAGAVTATGGTGTCTTTGVSLNPQHSLTVSVPAGGNSAVQTYATGAHMDNTSQTGCQGATFTIPVALVGASG